MMEVGKDSYVTVEEAGAYVIGHYVSSAAERARWEALADADKSALLVNACAELERLPFRGRKAVFDQLMAFPRLPMQYGKSQEPPAAVKAAQIELALWLSDGVKQEKQSKRKELQDQGVTSFSVGDLSESYAQGKAAKPAPLLCPKAANLLAPYLNGGYATC